MQTGMLGNSKVLREIWDGPLKDLLLKLNSKNGPEVKELLSKLLRNELMPIPPAVSSEGIKIVKTVAVKIGGGRTTDQIIADAKDLDAENRPNCINPNIKQKNIPSGGGHARTVILEFFEFDHYGPTSAEVRTRLEEPGYGYPTYEDGLRFQEDYPDDQLMRPHIFIPENPWRAPGGDLQALVLWNDAGGRYLNLYYYDYEEVWVYGGLFARRRYVKPLEK